MSVKPYNVVKARPVSQLTEEELRADEENLNLLFKFMYNRQMIWKKRFIKNEPGPWTDDAILSRYKFCNLYREHDRSCQWEIKNILLDHSLSLKDLVWKIMVYRTFNNPETFARALDKWQNGIPGWEEYDQEEFKQHIVGLRASGLNPFTNAYSIAGSIAIGKSLDEQYTEIVIPAIHEAIDMLMIVVKNATTPEQIISFLMTIPSISSFISHEYYQDFTYIPIYTDKEFMKFDQNDYTNLGPGSSQGVKLIFPNIKPARRVYAYTFLQELAKEKLAEIGEQNGDTEIFAAWDKDLECYIVSDEYNLSLNQIEGALCELSKYYRLANGIGNPRCPVFEPKTCNGLIVTREDNSQEEFISDGKSQARRRGRPSYADMGIDNPGTKVRSMSILTNLLDIEKRLTEKMEACNANILEIEKKLDEKIEACNAKLDHIMTVLEEKQVNDE